MKTWLLLAALGGAHVAQAAPFQITEAKISGGGGDSRGGAFRLSGTVTGAAAGKLEGGAFRIASGQWGLSVVTQLAEGPRLQTRLEGGVLVLFWDAPGYVLEQSSDLGGAWAAVETAGPPQNIQSVRARDGLRFFRLRPIPSSSH